MKDAIYFFLLTHVLFVIQFNCIRADDQTREFKIVKIAQGLVKGFKNTEYGTYDFFGIPYAMMPTGPNKFKAPLPALKWKDTFEAINEDIVCPQYVKTNNRIATFFAGLNTPRNSSSGALIMGIDSGNIEEDCLIANVFVPNTEKNNLPVLVYVHGGNYQKGSGNFATPRDLVRKGELIVITFNYRLGIHGFLCLGTEDIPGNAGMKDQVAALRWVKSNIDCFGGNPNDITIAGYSAAVELLALSKTSRGLIKRVISESGTGVGVWSMQQDPLRNAKTFAEQFIFESDDIFALEDFYKSTPIEQLNIRHEKDIISVFVPCVERNTTSEIFLNEAPSVILRKGNFHKLPLLIGVINMEGLSEIDIFEEWKDRMNKNFSKFLPNDLGFKTTVQKKEIAKAVKDFYFGSKPVDYDTIHAYIDYFTDLLFVYPTIRSVRAQVEAGNNNVYLYKFSYCENLTQEMTPIKFQGVNNCAQTFTIFEIPWEDNSLWSSENKIFKTLMKKLWANFIKYGKPVPKVTKVFPSGWPASSANGTPYMNLNLPPKLKNTLLKVRTKFWDNLYDSFYTNPKAPVAPTPIQIEQL